jgi:opacity protein-like surface antigen
MYHPQQKQSVVLPPRAVALAALLVTTGLAQAADVAYPVWTFGGYGSLGVAYSDYDQADFTSNPLKTVGVGATHRFNGNLDSRLAAQLGVKLDKKWSAVVQVGVEQRYDSTFRPQLEWANIKYQATPDLSLRIGRIALPIFLVADYRKIGYAYPWVRTPNEVYGAISITNSDGADVSYRWQSGSVKHTTQAFFGRNNVYLTKSTDVKARKLVGVTHTAERGPATVRVSAFTGVLDTNVARDLFNAYRLFGPAGVAIADKYDVIDKRATGYAIGANYDPGKWFLMAEGGRVNTRSFLGHTSGMYASAGYRAGEFTPYVVYAQNKAKAALGDPGLPLAGVPPAYQATVAQLNGYLDDAIKSAPSQTNFGFGVRWDLRPDMAVKLQYEHVTPRDGTHGTLLNRQPGFASGHAANVTSAVLDFVF